MGMISALGANVDENWSSLSQGRPGITPISLVDTSDFKFSNGAEVRGFDPCVHFPGSSVDTLDRFAQFAVVTAREAMKDAQLAITPDLANKSAVITGSCLGGQSTQDAQFV